MDKINIITYNVLSSNLANLMQNEIKDGKKVYPTEIMDNEIRWKKIESYIKHKFDLNLPNLIFCIQEVSEDWLIKFATLFNSISYSYINVQYGRVFDGNMGVLIAYPCSLNIIKSEFYRIGNHIIITDDISSNAASRSNTAILAIFENPLINTRFGVVTYHMPCEPSIPQISLIHSKILYKKIIRFMNKNRWILAGDFNMVPDMIAYKYLSSFTRCIWKDVLTYYPITNHAYIKRFEFSGCLDYIFYSDDLKCLDIKFNKINNIIPDVLEPSDHIPIFATFEKKL
jgi:mRNA deadenylase 3'-5' endonuclease subunit Ccr4